MGRHDILHAIFVITFWIICFFIDIINIIIWILFIISQKCVIFAFISTKFLILSLKFFCLPLLIVWMLMRAITFFATNITLFFLWLMAIVVIIVVIVSIVALLVLIIAIILFKLTIRKILNIGSVVVIMCHNRWLKLKKKFFKDCYRNK